MTELNTDYFYTPSKWTVALYEKRGRAYKEIGIFFEGDISPDEAFDLFRQFSNCVPTWQAVEHAIETKINEPEIETPSYEVRLLSGTRVLGSFLWEGFVLDICIADHESKNARSYIVTTEVKLDDEYDMDFPDEWDWDVLFETGRGKVLDVLPVDVVELNNLEEGSKNEEKENTI